MRKLEHRAVILLILAFTLFGGLAFFVFRYVNEADGWAVKYYNSHVFRNGHLATGRVYDRNGTLMADNTGKKINIHVQSAGNHLDVEPLTATDTSKMCDLWGVSSASSISYLRRPMLIVTKDNRQIICSVYGTPHGTQDITSNNFPGQFCIHFLNSTTSGTKVVSSYAVTALNTARSMVLAAGKTLTTLK